MIRAASRMLRLVPSLLVAACAAGGSVSSDSPATTGPAARPKNLVILVTDGGGAATWSLARIARGEDLSVARMPVVGMTDTREVDGGITDSAAGATALAIGMKTFNGAIGVGPACRDLWARDSIAVRRDPASCAPERTLLERAEAAGKSTGLVTTTVVTDATPAAFAAHAPNRYMYGSIAPQMLASGVDVLMGGGRAIFDGTADTGAGDLLDAACRDADCPPDASALAALGPSGRRLIGLFAAEDMPRPPSSSPELETMARVALERLALDEDGFFLLVETEWTDTDQHANEPIDVIREDIVTFDRAVGAVLDFAERNPETLVVVTADHETGGMALHRSRGQWALNYTGPGHTGAMVPLFAAGPGSERLAGVRGNDEVGRILRELLLGEDH